MYLNNNLWISKRKRERETIGSDEVVTRCDGEDWDLTMTRARDDEQDGNPRNSAPWMRESRPVGRLRPKLGF